MGLAIKIKGADYSAKNVGKVTFIADNATTAKIKAVDYCAAIGDSTYKTELESMFLSLLDNELWSKISCIYPVLGNSVDALSTNAKKVEENKLITYPNASVGSKTLLFSNMVGVGATDATPMDGYNGELSLYAVFKHNRVGLNGTTLQCFSSDNGGVVSINRISTAFYATCGSQNIELNLDTATVGRIGITNVGQGTTASAIKDGIYLGDKSSATLVGVNPNLSIGVKAGQTIASSGSPLDTASVDLFSGEVYFYAIGKLNKSELLKFDEIVANFLSQVKSV